jgi:hypothetical protein
VRELVDRTGAFGQGLCRSRVSTRVSRVEGQLSFGEARDLPVVATGRRGVDSVGVHRRDLSCRTAPSR